MTGPVLVIEDEPDIARAVDVLLAAKLVRWVT